MRSVLDVAQGSATDGANVRLYENVMADAQQWMVCAQSDGSGFVRIVNLRSGKVLDVSGGRAESGANVQLYRWNGTRGQLWLPLRQEDGSLVLYSALGNDLVLDVSGGSVANGANIGLWKANGTGAQRFCVTSCDVSVASGGRVLPDGVYTLSPCLDPSPSAATQQWLLHPVSVPSKIGYQNPSQFFQASQYNVILPRAAYQTPFCYVTPSRIAIDATREQCVEAFIARAYSSLSVTGVARPFV